MGEVATAFDQKDHNTKIEEVENQLLDLPQVEAPVRNMFAPGVYIREITMYAGSVVIGHEHKTEHFNIILTGKAKVVQDDKTSIIQAPDIFVSKPGVRKVLHIIEDMVWATVHPTKETDLTKLEEEIIQKSDVWLYHENNLEYNANKELTNEL